MDSVAIIAPVEQVVDTNFHHLDIAVAGGERIAGKERGRGRNGESPVAQPEIVVLELQRQMRRKRPFGASADQPAAGGVAAVGEVGEGPAGDRRARRQVGDGQVVVVDPAAAGLAVHQPLIDGIAEAGRHCRDQATVVADLNGSNARNENPKAVVAAGPVKVPFAADDEVADLVIAADLPAAQECAVAAVVVEVRQEARFRPVVVGPGAADVGADVESGPTQHGQHRRGQRRPDGQIRRPGDRCAKRNKGDACNQCLKFHRVPLLIAPSTHDWRPPR